MGENKEKYAIGDQDFKSMREGGFLYVDKTRYIQTILDAGKYYFLTRPRRFGKSLFLSTLRYFFEGQRDLFKGLYIDSANWDWSAYPVLHLDLNRNKYEEIGILNELLDNQFREWEEKYDVKVIADLMSSRFQNIIKAAHIKTGRRVVILVDEFDKPTSKLAGIYSNFKSSAEHIRLVFMTGISRFSQLSTFSDLNNLNDISFDNDYADICGLTEKELLDYLQSGIQSLAEEMDLSYEKVCQELKLNYGGYRFAKKGSEIYNPWSVLSAIDKKDIRNYWNDAEKTSIVAEKLRNADVDIERTLNARWRLDDLAALDILGSDPTAILYQAGYLTISNFDRRTNTVGLKVPNEEVKRHLFTDLLPLYR